MGWLLGETAKFLYYFLDGYQLCIIEQGAMKDVFDALEEKLPGFCAVEIQVIQQPCQAGVSLLSGTNNGVLGCSGYRRDCAGKSTDCLVTGASDSVREVHRAELVVCWELYEEGTLLGLLPKQACGFSAKDEGAMTQPIGLSFGDLSQHFMVGAIQTSQATLSSSEPKRKQTGREGFFQRRHNLCLLCDGVRKHS